MSNQTSDELSLGEIVSVVLRHKKKVLLFACVVVVCATTLAVILPAKFGSESKVLMLIGRESVTLDPVASTGKVININTTREIEMKTVRDLMKSREVLAKVVEELGADAVLQPPADPGVYDHATKLITESKLALKNRVKRWLGAEPPAAGEPGGPAGPDEQAILALQESISISGSKESSVISIAAEARSPEMAQALASAVVDAYIREHARLHTTSGSEEFFREQKQLIENQLQEKRSRMSDLKTEMGIGSVEAEFLRLEEEKSGIATLRQTLTRDLAGTTARCVALQEAIDAEEEVIITERSEGMSNEATAGIRQQLYALEVEERKAAQLFTPNHPRLVTLREQLADLREQFAQESADRTEVKFGLNVSREALALELEQQQSQLAQLKAQLEVVERQWESVLASLQGLNEKSSELEQLDQDIAFLARSYDTYSDSLEQSRIGSSLNSQLISNINIAQPASLVTEPIGPKRTLILAGGLLLAILGAFPLAFLMEYLDGRLQSAAEVEAIAGIPVLATIPKQAVPLKIPKIARSKQYVG